MNKGRATCEVLKGIRLQIARENCIDYQIDECKFEGNCSGTCPKCEADIRFLERELGKQNKLGKAVVIAGLSVGLLGGLTGCGHEKQINTTQKDVTSYDSTIIKTVLQDTLKNDSIIEISKHKTPQKIHDVTPGIIEDVFPEDLPDVYRYVEQMPEFPGGTDSLQLYLKNNIKYPESTRRYPSGIVFLEFVVEKDGSITNVKVLIEVDEDLDAEAVRVIENMPKWKPGRQQGKPVRVSYQIPIRFSLQ